MLTQSEGGAKQVLMLGVAGEVFAIDARAVREILDPVAATKVPGARRFVSRLINVRGKIIPLADLRSRFGMSPAQQTADTRIVVIDAIIGGEIVAVAMVADKVHEVTELDESLLQPAPPVGMKWQPEFIKAIGKWNEDFIVVPDLERIFN